MKANFFSDACFAAFRKTLDGEMKRLRSLGMGVVTKQAEPVIEDEEDRLWEAGCLGEHSPQALSDTI